MADLTGAERRWLDGQAERPASRANSTRIRTAVNNWHEAVRIAVQGICNETASIPAPARAGQPTRRSSGPSNPTQSAFLAAIDRVDLALTKLGHLFDDCPICDETNPGRAHNDRVITLSKLDGVDYTELADALSGISPTSPRSVAEWTAAALAISERQGWLLIDRWHDMRNSGAETDVLRQYAGETAMLASRAGGVAGLVRQWTAGVQVRLCLCGCGAHAPTGRRVTEACEKRRKRAAKDCA